MDRDATQFRLCSDADTANPEREKSDSISFFKYEFPHEERKKVLLGYGVFSPNLWLRVFFCHFIYLLFPYLRNFVFTLFLCFHNPLSPSVTCWIIFLASSEKLWKIGPKLQDGSWTPREFLMQKIKKKGLKIREVETKVGTHKSRSS